MNHAYAMVLLLLQAIQSVLTPLHALALPGLTGVQRHPRPGYQQAQTARKTTVNVEVSRDIAPSAKIQLTLNTMNVAAVSVTAYTTEPLDWLVNHRQEQGVIQSGNRPRPNGGTTKTWSVSVATKDNPPNPQQQDRYYSRQVNLPFLVPGVYVVVVSGGGASSWTVVNVTNLSVVTKESPKHLLVWATDALAGHPIDQARVFVYKKRTKQFEGATKPNGTFFTTLPPGEHTVIVNHGKDYAAVEAFADDPNGRLVAHFQTDRPIYRPGQTVQYKAILRRTRDTVYTDVSNASVHVELRDPKNNAIDQADLKSNANGSIAGQFDIPQEGQSGGYTLVLSVNGQAAYKSFNVAMYRKPEYRVDTTPIQRRYLAGETLKFKVSAQYYFGAPVPQAEVRYTVRSSPNYYSYSDPSADDDLYPHSDGNLYPRDTYGQQPFVAEDVVHTDNNGEAIIEIKSDPKATDSDYNIDVTVSDSSRRQVTGSASVPVYEANVRLGLSSDVLFVPLGRLFPFWVSAVDLDGKPVSANVTLIEWHQVWNEKKKEYQNVELTRTKLSVPSTGHAKASLAMGAEGEVFIDAETGDGTGRTAKARFSTYVVGPKGTVGKVQTGPTIETRLNRKSYRPGDMVASHVLANTKGWPILLVEEGQDIYNYTVVQGSASWEFPTTKEMSPNAYLTAAQWVKSQMVSSNIGIPLPNKDNLLSVSLTPDKKEYRPGDTATFKVTAKKADGSPAESEVALNVVDAAIYALSGENTQDLYALYWGWRQNQVDTRQAAPEELSGGAYQKVSTVAPLRQRFEDTAYWNPFVLTGPDGTGSASFEMPGNLTTWKAGARAVTGSTAVGSGYSDVVATRPVTLRLATPRQMVQGDKLTVIGTVNNRTSSPHTFVVEMKPEGLNLESEESQKLSVPANSQGTVLWNFEADHVGAQPPALTAQVVCQDVSEADRADYSDALRMTFPVLPDGITERFVTGGAISGKADASLDIPADKIEPGGVVHVKIWSGIQPLIEERSKAVLDSYRYGTMAGVDQLEVAEATGLKGDDKTVREAIALLSRCQQPEGWGYWETCRPRPQITAEVIRAFGLVHGKLSVPGNMVSAGTAAAKVAYNQTNLWEYKALLADAITIADTGAGKPLLDEVLKRGQDMSPYAQLRLAEGFLSAGDAGSAGAIVESLVPAVSVGPSSAYLPVGDGIGWQANSMQTTAMLLEDLMRLKSHTDIQSKLAEWLVEPSSEDWPSLEDETERILALQAYLADRPAAPSAGEASITAGGQSIQMAHSKVGDMLIAEFPTSLLVPGNNTLSMVRGGEGEAFYEIEARVYRPLKNEKDMGIRVARRYEVKNAAGIWTQLNRTVQAGEIVRSTILIWGDNVPDLIKVNDPLPAGFEFVDEDPAQVEEETDVRDAAIERYVLTSGQPAFFVSYIRGESEGDLAALPASAEVLRRPAQRGQTDESRVRVLAGK